MFPGTVIADGRLLPEKLLGWMDTELLREESCGAGPVWVTQREAGREPRAANGQRVDWLSLKLGVLQGPSLSSSLKPPPHRGCS